MPALTRRTVLFSVTSGVAALAGCSGGESEDVATIDRRLERPVEDYELRRVRDESGSVLFSEMAGRETAAEPGRFGLDSMSVVVSEAELEDISFGDGPEADRLASFADGIDFDSSSLVLLSMPVSACYHATIQSVTVDRDELDDGDLHPSVDTCRELRPADVECNDDVDHTVGFAIRLPFAAEQSRGHGRGRSSSCRPSPDGDSFEATVTPAERGDDE